jgi:hypothetical protein
MVRLQVVLDPTEGRALTDLAFKELRDPRDQIRLIVRQELERRGLLPPSAPAQPDSVCQEENGDCAAN